MSNQELYLYFPRCKIMRANFVPQAHGKHHVVSMFIRSLTNSPKHYPDNPLLVGKADFYFGLECDQNWLSKFESSYYQLFNTFPSQPVEKIVKTEVSVIAKFSPEGKTKLETIGVGKPNGEITIYNNFWEEEEMDLVYQVSKLHYGLSSKKTAAKKVKI